MKYSEDIDKYKVNIKKIAWNMKCECVRIDSFIKLRNSERYYFIEDCVDKYGIFP